ncbi:MAG: PEP/pyruvate-binding domain-containing protein [Patescibacteria group bacterium]|nr:PEP/pyruvate-binding domain-containing protein [Patescibacteria group bacterium]
MSTGSFILDERDSSVNGNISPVSSSLAELRELGIHVPEFFVISALAYTEFIRENNLEVKIRHLLETVNFENPHSLMQVSSIIKSLIIKAKLSQKFAREIYKRYKRMGSVFKDVPVSVTIHNPNNIYPRIKGETNLLVAIKESWASFFNPGSLSDLKNPVLLIQKEIKPKVSGICITGGLDKSMVIGSSANITLFELEEVYKTSKKIDNFYYFPQEIGWAFYKNKPYVLKIKPALCYI